MTDADAKKEMDMLERLVTMINRTCLNLLNMTISRAGEPPDLTTFHKLTKLTRKALDVEQEIGTHVTGHLEYYKGLEQELRETRKAQQNVVPIDARKVKKGHATGSDGPSAA